jgi:hypothetical protein
MRLVCASAARGFLLNPTSHRRHGLGGWRYTVFEVVRNMPDYGVGTKVKRATWRGEDCFWTITQVKPREVSALPSPPPLLLCPNEADHLHRFARRMGVVARRGGSLRGRVSVSGFAIPC